MEHLHQLLVKYTYHILDIDREMDVYSFKPEIENEYVKVVIKALSNATFELNFIPKKVGSSNIEVVIDTDDEKIIRKFNVAVDSNLNVSYEEVI